MADEIKDNFESMTIAQLMQVGKVLTELKSEKLPVLTSLKLVKLVRFIAPIESRYLTFCTEQAKRLGELTKDEPPNYKFSTESAAEYNAAVKAESEKQVVVSENLKIKISDLQSLQLSIETVNGLFPILSDM